MKTRIKHALPPHGRIGATSEPAPAERLLSLTMPAVVVVALALAVSHMLGQPAWTVGVLLAGGVLVSGLCESLLERVDAGRGAGRWIGLALQLVLGVSALGLMMVAALRWGVAGA